MSKADKAKLPRAVYYQCVWTVKDIDRLCRLEVLKKQMDTSSDIVLCEDEDCMMLRPEVANEAKWKLNCIREALKEIPEEYRMHTVECFTESIMPLEIAHENTWKKWKRVFIKELAFKLNLI